MGEYIDVEVHNTLPDLLIFFFLIDLKLVVGDVGTGEDKDISPILCDKIKKSEFWKNING